MILSAPALSIAEETVEAEVRQAARSIVVRCFSGGLEQVAQVKTCDLIHKIVMTFPARPHLWLPVALRLTCRVRAAEQSSSIGEPAAKRAVEKYARYAALWQVLHPGSVPVRGVLNVKPEDNPPIGALVLSSLSVAPQTFGQVAFFVPSETKINETTFLNPNAHITRVTWRQAAQLLRL